MNAPQTLAAPILIKALRHKNPTIRSGAAEMLGILKDSGGKKVKALLKVLEDKHPSVRHEAITALGNLQDAEALPTLIRILKEADKESRRRSVEALGKIRNRRGVDALIYALDDEDAIVRKNAIDALANIRDNRRVFALTGMLGDTNPDVRLRAAAILKALNWTAQTEQEDIAFEIALQHWDAPVLSSPSGVDSLIRTMEENSAENTHARVNAIMALGKIRDTRAVKPIIKVLEQEYSNIRETAVTALGDIGDTRALKPLIKTLQDENPNVRTAAATALGAMTDSQLIRPLTKVLGKAYQKEKNPDVQKSIIIALGNLGDERATKIFVHALKNDNDAKVRLQAATELDKLGWKPQTVSEQIAYHIAGGVWDALIPFGAQAVFPLVRLFNIEREREIREKVEITLNRILVSVETVIFGDGDLNDFNPRTSLYDFEVSELTVPLSALKTIIIHTPGYNFHQVERFLTYAINSIGQKYLKEHVEVHIYGESDAFHPNLRNNFENLCKRVEFHQET